MVFTKKAKIVSLICTLTLLLFIPFATTNASNDVHQWPAKTINDPKKVWTISFSQPLRESTVKNSTVYVEDEQYRLFFTEVSLSSDKKTIIVTPRHDYAYDENKTYRLNILKDVTSDKGKKLEKSIVMPFSLNGVIEEQDKQNTNKAVQNVNFFPKNFATMVTVVSGDTVHRVTANSKEMHYEGNNTYSIGFSDLKVGSKVKIEAFDLSGKRIYSQDHTVN